MKRLLFVAFSGLLTVLFLVALGWDTNRQWNRYQSQFFKTLRPSERRGLSDGIKQIIASDLNRVDRCTTCHVAIDKPALALAQEPFKAHPGQWLVWHPVEKFGCTVCHGGQGLATETKAAHGQVPHWEEPLLQGQFVQASCASCHGNLKDIASHVPMLVKGKRLFEEVGCYGCHTVKERGGTLSQDLTEVGSKPYELIEADFEMMEAPHDRIHWLMTKLKNPRVLNPGVRPEVLPLGEEEVFPSAMPNFGLADEQIRALTVYLLSLTDSDYPASYVVPAVSESTILPASSVERGRLIFEKNGCAGCHGIGGAGGRRNWNAGLGEEVPALLYVKAYYSEAVERLKGLIRNGRQPVPRADPKRPAPGLYMPAWKDKISESELDDLVAYLFSLADELPVSPPSNAASVQTPADG